MSSFCPATRWRSITTETCRDTGETLLATTDSILVIGRNASTVSRASFMRFGEVASIGARRLAQNKASRTTHAATNFAQWSSREMALQTRR